MKTIPPTLIAAAAAVFQVSAADILSDSRRADVTLARHAIAWALRHESGMQLEEIAAALDRDHSTISQGLRALERKACYNARLALQISALLRR
jgi:chromosomal replication initiation ATPase DnaA